MKDGTTATFQKHHMAISRPLVHEINNALTGVITFSKLASRKTASLVPPAPPEFVELLTQLEASAQRSAAVAKALLDYLPKTPLAREAVDLTALVERSVEESLSRTDPLDPAPLQVGVDLPRQPTTILACPGPLLRAVRALLTNAVEAVQETRGERPARIAIACGTDGASARILVEDSGPGIPSHLVERIFEPFFTTKDAARHLGLGLFVAREAALLHGGDLVLDSSGRRGSRFVLQIPLTWDEPSQDGAQAGRDA